VVRRIVFLAAFFFGTSLVAQPTTSPLTRGLADALYAKLAGGSTIGGTTTFTNITVNGTCTGCSSGAATWGSITGTLSNQTDLQSALNLKAPLASPAFSGTVTAPAFSGALSGNSTTASAADHTPTACGANTFAQSQSTVWAFTCAALTLAAFPTIATNTVLGNATSGTAVPTALPVGTCSGASNALNWTTNTGFGCNGSITANTATTATTATNATNVAVTDDTTTNATMFPLWVTTASGNQASKVSSTKLTFNPSTGNLSATTLQTSGHVGVGVAPSATAGQSILVTDNNDNQTAVRITNSNAAGTSANAGASLIGDFANVSVFAQGSGRTTSRWGAAIGGSSEVIATAGGALHVGTTHSASMTLGTVGVTAVSIDTSQVVTLPRIAVTAGTATLANTGVQGVGWNSVTISNANVTALGATTTGDVTLFTLPAKMQLVDMKVIILAPDSSANALTVAVGRTSASFIDYIVASDAKAAANTVYGDASAERGTNLTGYDLPSYTGTTNVTAHFIKTTTNLSTVIGLSIQVDFKTELIP